MMTFAFERNAGPLAGVTQLVECDLAKVDVAGSNPVSRSISLPNFPPGNIFLPFLRTLLWVEACDAWIPAVVRSVYPVLALGLGGSVPVSHRLADSASVPDRRHRGGGRTGVGVVHTHSARPCDSTSCLNSSLDVNPLHPRVNAAQHAIGNGPRHARDLLRVNRYSALGAEQRNRVSSG